MYFILSDGRLKEASALQIGDVLLGEGGVERTITHISHETPHYTVSSFYSSYYYKVTHTQPIHVFNMSTQTRQLVPAHEVANNPDVYKSYAVPLPAFQRSSSDAAGLSESDMYLYGVKLILNKPVRSQYWQAAMTQAGITWKEEDITGGNKQLPEQFQQMPRTHLQMLLAGVFDAANRDHIWFVDQPVLFAELCYLCNYLGIEYTTEEQKDWFQFHNYEYTILNQLVRLENAATQLFSIRHPHLRPKSSFDVTPPPQAPFHIQDMVLSEITTTTQQQQQEEEKDAIRMVPVIRVSTTPPGPVLLEGGILYET